MRFDLIVKNKGGAASWKEPYDKPGITSLDAARKWANQTIANFNETLHPYESPRELVDVVNGEEKKGITSTHSWEKVSLTTQVSSRGMFDAMRCTVCGITAKRYGMTNIKIDSAFRGDGFNSCSNAIKILAKRKAKAEKK